LHYVKLFDLFSGLSLLLNLAQMFLKMT